MNEIAEQLGGAVAATATFGSADVADLVARRRTRRIAGAAVAGLLVLVGVGSVFWIVGGDDERDVEVIDDPPTSVPADPDDPGDPDNPAPVVEDPVGADGVTGTMSDLHVETIDMFGFTSCGADGEPGPPIGERANELEALIVALRDGGLHDQPFVVSSGGPQSIWGVPSVGLSSNYEPSLRWLADRAEPADVCVEFAEFGVRNLPPGLAPAVLDAASSGDELMVTAEGCAPKGEWVQPFVREGGGRVEVGIAVGRGQSVFTDDCPAPTSRLFSHTPGLEPVLATEPGTLFFAGPVAAGHQGGFTFDPVNVASDTTIGDDMIAQHADDPTVQFQVSDVFSGSPVAGPVGEVANDQWPITGAGRITVPAGAPAGTYHVRLISTPELNGLLVVGDGVAGGSEDGEAAAVLPLPTTGWFVADLDEDGQRDVVDGVSGRVFLVRGEFVESIEDSSGQPISVPLDGDGVFTCNAADNTLMTQRDDPIGDELARRIVRLELTRGVAQWLPSPSFFHDDWELPANGNGCEAFAAG